MTAPDTSDPLDLSGVWHGIYSYPHSADPVDFVATLADADGWLTGTVREIGTTGRMGGIPLDAFLQGRRAATKRV